jgi:hypothetical protein
LISGTVSTAASSEYSSSALSAGLIRGTPNLSGMSLK